MENFKSVGREFTKGVSSTLTALFSGEAIFRYFLFFIAVSLS